MQANRNKNEDNETYFILKLEIKIKLLYNNIEIDDIELVLKHF